MTQINKLNITLEHCYGIHKLKEDFDFSGFRTVLIYAPNGVMKTSFAKTFKAIASGKEKPCDQLDSTLVPTHEICINDTEEKINPDDICVIEPYSKSFDAGDKVLTLLANKETREEYLSIFKEIENLKKSTLSPLLKLTGSKNYESEIIESFSNLEKKNIFEIFESILLNIKQSPDTFKFAYNDVFDSEGKVEEFLNENYTLLEQYLRKFEELISESTFFGRNSRNIFGATEAKNLRDSLEGDDYFSAGHSLVLNQHGGVDSQKRYSEILDEEIEKIFSDSELKTLFEQITKKLEANKKLKSFKRVIENKENALILPRLADYNKFRCEVWFSFLREIEPGIETLIELYLQKKPDIELIIKNAEDNLPHWEEAIREFEIRFSNMPFSVDVENKADAVLNAKTPSIKFKYKGKDIPRDKLVEDVLSQGEKRAFYLLNVIFQIKSRKLENKRTLFIVDDIADSFDYRNKYAIVEYLKDLSRVENFYVIVLTHNFDFFRTLRSRILFRPFNNTHSYVAERTDSQIFLIPAVNKNVIDPFANWRLGVNNNQKHLIACVPFVRNLIEFKFGTNHKYFIQLTHVLHIKQQDTVNDVNATVDISIADIEPIFNEVLSGIKFTFDNKDTLKLVAVIDSVAEGIIHEKNTDTIILEDKIILAISIRLKAEKFMLSIMSDIETIDDNQTGYLIRTYKERFRDQEGQNDIIKTLETVGIITPENIHLNSFMYEPILDMGIDELIRLYGAVSSF